MTDIPDLINAAFEVFGGLFVAFSCVEIWKTKHSAGVSKLTICFFISWGFWNLFYYTNLEQIFSFVGGISVCIANIVWLSLIIYYDKYGNGIQLPAGDIQDKELG